MLSFFFLQFTFWSKCLLEQEKGHRRYFSDGGGADDPVEKVVKESSLFIIDIFHYGHLFTDVSAHLSNAGS